MILDKIIKVFFWILLGVGLGYTWAFMSIARAYETPHKAGWVASDHVKQAMAYHGIRFCENKSGTLYFWRNNQWCKLWTVACLSEVDIFKK